MTRTVGMKRASPFLLVLSLVALVQTALAAPPTLRAQLPGSSPKALTANCVVRLHVIRVADDDGGRPANMTPDLFMQSVTKANEIYAPAGIQFQFDPNPSGPDWTTLNSTLINNNDAGNQDSLQQERREATFAEAAKYPGQAVVFFRYGSGQDATGQGYSGNDLNYVMMPGFHAISNCGQPEPFVHLAHELGHFLLVYHTFATAELATVAQAEAYFTSHNNDPNAFDGDGFSDTLPDPMIAELDCTNAQTTTLGGVLFALPRDNLMNYWWNGTTKVLSPSQGIRARIGAVSRELVPQTLKVVSRSPNRLDLFALGTDQALWHTWWDGSKWGAWHSLGGVLTSTPAAVAWGPNRLDVFALGTDHGIWHIAWDGQAWTPWHGFNLPTSFILSPEVVSWGPDRLDVFAVGEDKQLWHISWGNAWYADCLGGTLASSPTAVARAANRLDIFATSALDKSLQHIAWTGSTWTAWESLGGELVLPADVVSLNANRLDIFATGLDLALWHIRWDGAAWSGWERVGGYFVSSPQAVARVPNQLEVFAVGGDHSVRRVSWNGWNWADSSIEGSVMTPPQAVAWDPDRLDVFAIGFDSGVWHNSWSLLEFKWGGWSSMGVPTP